MKRGGGRRYYRVNDVDLLKGIRQLLYGKGYTIKGVQRILKERGVAHVTDIGRGQEPQMAEPAASTEKVTRAKGNNSGSGSTQKESAEAGLSPDKKEGLKLALADLAAAKRLLSGEKKT